jgi:hypothetical protein
MRRRLYSKGRPGVDVMYDHNFRQFSAKMLQFFSKFLQKNAQYLRLILGGNILKIITSVPSWEANPGSFGFR